MKNSKQEKLDQLLKKQLSEGTAPVPDLVWDRIEEELFPKKKRRFFFWWFFGGICTLLIGAFLALAFSGQKTHTQTVKKTALNTPVSRAKTVVSADEVVSLNGFKTKGRSQHRIPASSRNSIETNKPNTHFTKTKRELHSSRRQENSQKFRGRKSKGVKARGNKQSINLQEVESKTPGPLLTVSPKEGTPSPGKSDPGSNQETQNRDSQTKTDSLAAKELTYEEILALLKRDFPEKKEEVTENTSHSWFSIGVYGGPSLYSTATFKDYFTSGQLSKRSFASSGFELGLQARFKVGNRFQIYTGLAFNQKQTEFNYNLAITEQDYFTYIANNEKVPFENITEDSTLTCFLASGVSARYRIQSTLFSLGTRFEFLKFGKFSADLDLRLSCNILASLRLKEVRVLDIPQPPSEHFSYLQPGLGIGLNYQLNKSVSIGLAPFFSKQFYLKESFSRKVDELVIPLTVSFHL